jgi:hypothetical protein
MILSIVSVGDFYIDSCLPHLDKFKNKGYDIKILTDKPEKFIGYDTQLYENKIFSYFDKLLFPLRLIEKYQTEVLYVDSDWIKNVPDYFIDSFNGFDEVLYYDNWKDVTFSSYVNDYYWKDLIYYFNLNKIEYNHLILPLEWILYYPKIENISNVIYDIEKIKPIFDWISTVVPSQYMGNGNGEGLGLSYVLDKNKIKMNKFDLTQFQPQKENKKLI